MTHSKKNNGSLLLAGDIGGTKCSLGIFLKTEQSLELLTAKTYASGSASTLEEIIAAFLRDTDSDVAAACLGIAGPVIAGSVRTTNLPWHVAETELKKKFGWHKVKLVNDLVAMAGAIPQLKGEQLLEINPNAEQTTEGNIGLIAAGTGLGEALLVRHKGAYVPCASEGGHKDFAPKNDLEYRLHKHLAATFGHVSIERLLSGSGLVNIYRFLRQEEGSPEPGWLSEKLAREDAASVISGAASRRQDKVCEKSLDLFVELYGAEAGNLALQAMTKGGIYIGGGIAPKISESMNGALFMNAFTAKGRMQPLLAKIPVRLILEPQVALLGAAACLNL